MTELRWSCVRRLGRPVSASCVAAWVRVSSERRTHSKRGTSATRRKGQRHHDDPSATRSLTAASNRNTVIKAGKPSATATNASFPFVGAIRLRGGVR